MKKMSDYNAIQCRFRYLTLALMLFLVILSFPSVALAEDVKHPAELTNWAYAVFQGSGVYKINDRTIGVLSLPFSYSLNSAELKKGEGALEITYPIVLGMYDFDIRKYGFDHLGDRFGTISLIPGLHYHYAVEDFWIVTPFVDAGAGMDISNSGYSWIYSIGVESRYFFDFRDKNFMLGNRLRWAGYTVGNSGLSDDYTSFESILEHRINTSWRVFDRAVDFTVYGLNQLNFNAKILHHHSGNHPELKAVWEVGTTVGFLSAGNKDDFFHSIRLGIGYRVSEDLRAVTFMIGDVF